MIYFSARGFDLRGPVEGLFSGWSKVMYIYLDNNQLTGSLPANLDKETPSLLDLVLSENQLKGEVPTSLGALSNLVVLDLAGNELEGKLNPSLGSLESLSKYIVALSPFWMKTLC